ncbi:hypothetical protein BD626DRAFT_414082 [Schizophyllum amplum]|uniref:Uncharacterized protein n=1 Tax=Schizophyllum amplum TaxID=97359 RepID=A0A550BV50_9AGAR|nr:hypothetical protein BD626DRAFT_414082 [Auriculariopsis ampla]
MTTAGEKQYYVVALVDALMENLPADWRVGMLYDIACQIHLSAVKHGLFSKYIDRLQFAVSVFHAFGHDWPCQLIYHPRKCVGFGLTDGEGCERFWYSISKLIPYLRVAGFHLRQYTLNGQIAFATHEAVANVGAWFARKATNLDHKRAEAQALLMEAGTAAADSEFLRKHLEQSRDLGRIEVEKALDLLDSVEQAEALVSQLRNNTGDEDLDPEEEADLRTAEAALLSAKVKYDRKVAQLGVVGKTLLKTLTKNKLIHRRANALVLLRRVQVGIIKRKMEVERVASLLQNMDICADARAEHKLRKHTTTAAERRAGTIKTVISRYNKACRELNTLIKRQRTRKGSCSVRPLKELPKTGVWDLDIDNPCWDDLRFDAEDADAALIRAAPPPWMADENVRKGIRAQLLLDRCAEEDARLSHEKDNVREWFEDEWITLEAALKAALSAPDSPALLHQLRNRRRWLMRVACIWSRHFPGVRGPSEREMTQALGEWAAASCDPPDSTRSGAVFSNVVPIPCDVDLDALFAEAESNEADESAPESDVPTDDGSDLSSLSLSEAMSSLSELTDLEHGNAAVHASRSLPRSDSASTGGNSKARKSARHRKRRREERGNQADSSKRLRASKVLDAGLEPVSFKPLKAPVTSTGFTALRDTGEANIAAFANLKGFRYLEWDGQTSTALTVGDEQVVIAVLAGAPKDPQWPAEHQLLADELEAAASRMTFSADERQHRRGDFRVKAHGISHGGGQKEPGPLKHGERNKKELDRIVKLKPMQRLGAFSSSVLSGWQPPIHQHYSDVRDELYKWKPRLRRFQNFKKSVWLCLTLNFGPQTMCYPHRDFGNLAFGFCAITALGRFDPNLGGHLILRELKLVVRFPPGLTIIIPSAILTHYNTAIGAHEKRFSATHYTAGAIFRFVAHGCRLNHDYYKSLDTAARRQSDAEDRKHWRKGWGMLAKVPGLQRAAREALGSAEAPSDSPAA